MTDRLRVGVVGAGNIAAVAQLPSLAGRDDVELAALVSRRPDPADLIQRWGFRSAYQTIDAMLDAERLDAVFILTPRSEHVQGVESVLRAGVDVFCEKPLATAAADAVRLADLADETRQLLMVGFNRRFAPTYQEGREAFGDGGAAFCVAQKNRNGSEYRATFENSIHMVDLLRWYCGGEVEEVAAHSAGDDRWQEEGTAALVRFDNGHTGVLMAARNAGGWEETLDAYGSSTSVHVEAPDRISVTRSGETVVREMRAEAFGWATATSTFGFRASVDHFLECVRDRSQPLTSGREAARTQELLDRILEVAGLPTSEQPNRAWSSHAVK
ncbi:MAG: Gfo/Idh/MocA family oxidoreductase [Mycetocola sp.]